MGFVVRAAHRLLSLPLGLHEARAVVGGRRHTLPYTTVSAMHAVTHHYDCLSYPILSYPILSYPILHYTTLHHTTLHYTTLHYTTHYIILYYAIPEGHTMAASHLMIALFSY